MKKHKFTWIDALVIAVVLLLIVGTCVKFFAKDSTSVTHENVQFTYQLKIEDVREFTANALQVGDTVYDNEGKGAVGVITDIAVVPATTVYTAPNGEAVEAEMEGRCDITLTLSAEGVSTGDTYKVGTYTLRANKSAVYFTKYSTWKANILSID